jgi:hypothetical protein
VTYNPLVGQAWNTIVGAMQGYPLVGTEWGQIVGQGLPPGLQTHGLPGASAIAHGPYGDPHGARGGVWGAQHHDRHGLPPVGWHNNPTLAAAEAAGIGPRAVLAPAPAPVLASRQGLPMNSGTFAFGYLDTALITSRPQRQAFRPERVFISPPIGGAGAQSWFVNDITIGNKSQLVQSGGLPGDMFANTSIDSFVTFETAQTAMDVTMSITLIQNGIEVPPFFYGGIIGTAAI